MYFLAYPQDHVEKCEKKPVECPNNCGEIIVQEEVGGSISADANRFVFLSSYLYMFLSIVPNFLCTQHIWKKSGNVQY